MKRVVNGVEVEFSNDSQNPIDEREGRLYVDSPEGTFTAAAVRSGDAVLVSYRGHQYRIEKGAARKRSTQIGTGEIHAPMPGRIADVLVKSGEEVKAGQRLVILEAMKTQQALVAPFDGSVTKLAAEPGSQVEEGQLLAAVSPLSKE